MTKIDFVLRLRFVKMKGGRLKNQCASGRRRRRRSIPVKTGYGVPASSPERRPPSRQTSGNGCAMAARMVAPSMGAEQHMSFILYSKKKKNINYIY